MKRELKKYENSSYIVDAIMPVFFSYNDDDYDDDEEYYEQIEDELDLDEFFTPTLEEINEHLSMYEFPTIFECDTNEYQGLKCLLNTYSYTKDVFEEIRNKYDFDFPYRKEDKALKGLSIFSEENEYKFMENLNYTIIRYIVKHFEELT